MKKNQKDETNAKKTTTNYPPDAHKIFCRRCRTQYNNGVCPITHSPNPSKTCEL